METRDYTACHKNAVNSLLPEYIKWISRFVFLCVFTYVSGGSYNVKNAMVVH